MRLVLDGNIYDRLSQDPASIRGMREACSEGRCRVIVTPVIVKELTPSPFGGVPTWFPVELVPEGVAIAGEAFADWAHIGDGREYDAHRGDSTKIRDAIIAQSAHSLADALVSEDRRCRVRLSKISDRCEAWSYADLREWLFGGRTG